MRPVFLDAATVR